MAEQNGDDLRIVKTIREVARHYGVSYATVSSSWRPAGMPGDRDCYDLDAIDAWRLTRQASGVTTGGSVSGDESTRMLFEAREKTLLAESRKKDAEARIKEMQAMRLENSALIDLDTVDEFMTAWLTMARNVLLTVPVKLKRFGDDVSDAATKEISLALHAIRKRSEKLTDLRKD